MSTSTSYLLLSRDMSRTMANLASDRTVSSSAQYYQANIGKVKTVDDLMNDYKLYTYVMKAYGLEDMAYARAFVKKVLTSDLSKADSFANKLTDKRYQDLAKAFNFTTTGTVAAVSDVQSDAQETEATGLYARSITARQDAAAAAVASYSAAIDTVTNVDAFLNDDKLFTFAMKAHGLGEQLAFASKSYYRGLLTSDVSDPGHPVNSISDATLRTKLIAFASAFDFAADGTVAPGGTAQTAASKSATVDGYMRATGNATATYNLERNADAYRAGIGAIASVDDLIADSKLYNVVMTAFGLDPLKVSSNDVRAALVSDPDDPSGAASTLGAAYQRLARAFNFAADGLVPAGEPAQTAADIANTLTRYFAHANASAQGDLVEFTTYKLTINNTTAIPNVDKFLENASVYNFTMRAFGLDPAITSKAFIRQILISDLSDPSSFANQQSDARFRTMASKFNFLPDGSILNGGPLQGNAAMEDLQQRYIAKGGGPSLVAQATSAYRLDMAAVTDVDSFLADRASFSVALVAFGFNKDTASAAFFRQVLTSDLSDPSSFANQQADPRYKEFAAAFDFASDGSLPVGGSAQTKVAEDLMVERFRSRTDSTSAEYRLRVTEEYKTAVAGIRTVSAFISAANDSIYNLALKAFGIDPATTSKGQIEDVLTSDVNSSTSVANKLGGGFAELARAFNFGTAGVVPVGTDTQSAAQLDDTINGYLARNSAAADAALASATRAFKNGLGSLTVLADARGTKPIDEFLNNSALFDYALRAYGLDPAQESKSTIRNALVASKTDAFSFINRPGNEKYLALANALNFDPDGSIGTPRMAQTLDDAKKVATKYATSYPAETKPANATAKTAQELKIDAETEYYATAILKISNVDELLADTRVTEYVLKAFGFETSTLRPADLKRILTSDLADPKSFANQSKDFRHREIAASFNFDAKGLSKRIPEQAAQSSAAIYSTYESYLRQTLEINAGNDNAGVRLALYFQRKAASITGPFSILADKALFEVVRTALQIPESAARADLDVLAKTIEKRLKISDFKDPAKVEKFLKQFTAIYDLANPSSGASSNTVALISGAEGGVSQDLLAGLQRVRVSRF